MVTLYYGVIDFFIGFLAGVKAFTAAVLGGIGSLPGAMLGGLLIGLIEAFWSGYFSIEYKDVAAFAHPGPGADLPAHRPARPAGDREGLMTAIAGLADRHARAGRDRLAGVAQGRRLLAALRRASSCSLPLVGLQTIDDRRRRSALDFRFDWVADRRRAWSFAGRLAADRPARQVRPAPSPRRRGRAPGSPALLAAATPTVAGRRPASSSPSCCRSCRSPTAKWSISAPRC